VRSSKPESHDAVDVPGSSPGLLEGAVRRAPGVWGGLAFWSSFTPSLLPRGASTQGIVGGMSAAIGYGLGHRRRGRAVDGVPGRSRAGTHPDLREHGDRGSGRGPSRRAVDELERAGGFDRSHLLVATTTGTGWLDPGTMAAFEHLADGDSAIVTMQYSHLPS
jgi:uncharacterized membrane protein